MKKSLLFLTTLSILLLVLVACQGEHKLSDEVNASSVEEVPTTSDEATVETTTTPVKNETVVQELSTFDRAEQERRTAHYDDAPGELILECADWTENNHYKGLVIRYSFPSARTPNYYARPDGNLALTVKEAVDDSGFFQYERGRTLQEWRGTPEHIGEFIDDLTLSQSGAYEIKVPAGMFAKSAFKTLTRTADANGFSYQYGRVFIDAAYTGAQGVALEDAIEAASPQACVIKYY